MLFTKSQNLGKVPNPSGLCSLPYSEQKGWQQKAEITVEINYII